LKNIFELSSVQEVIEAAMIWIWSSQYVLVNTLHA